MTLSKSIRSRSTYRRLGIVLSCIVVGMLASLAWAGSWHLSLGVEKQPLPQWDPCRQGAYYQHMANQPSPYGRAMPRLVLECGENILPPPSALTATAGSSGVTLSWTIPPAATGIDHFEVWRSFDRVTVVLSPNPGPTVTTFLDTTASPGTSYLYRVRAVDATGNVSTFSNLDLSTTILFTDDPLNIGTTPVKAQHVTELRDAVNAVRTSAGLAPATWTDPTLPGIVIKTVHVQELRTRLDEALVGLGLPTPSYTDPTLAPGVTVIKAAHVEELRQAVR